jgi:hypothetical protein
MKPPEAVAKKILHCLESPRPPIRARVTAVAACGAIIRRILPAALIDAAMIAGIRKKIL